jgi:hypothetical protein
VVPHLLGRRAATPRITDSPKITYRFGVDQLRRRFSKPPKVRVVRGCFQVLSGCLGLPEVTSVAVFGGLLIHPDPFARTNFRLFCLRYVLLSCAETPPFAV